MKKLFLLVALLLPFAGLFSQKMLLLEKANHARTTKFYVGDGITYRLKDKDLRFWQESAITDIFPDEKSIALNGRKISLAEIHTLRLRRSGLFRGIGTQLMVFGGSWLAFSGIQALRDKDPVDSTDFAITGASVGTGLLLRKLPFFRYKYRHMGDKYRLRVIEISFPKQG